MNINTNIIMHDGHTKIAKNIKIGDKLMSPDGNYTTVVDVNTSTDIMFNIIPEAICDNLIINCKQKMLFKAMSKMTKILWNNNKLCFKIWWFEKYDDKHKLFYVERTTFNKKRFNVSKKLKPDPSITYYSTKEDAKQAALEYLDMIKTTDNYINDNQIISISLQDYYYSSRRFRRAFYRYSIPINFNTIKLDINPYEFGMTLVETHASEIPFEYKCNSNSNRMELLAGIIDCKKDHNKTNIFEIKLNTYILNDIQFIARTLGIKTHMTDSTLILSHNSVSKIPLRVKRSKLQYKEHNLLSLVKIKQLNRDTCITLNVDGQYLLYDCSILC